MKFWKAFLLFVAVAAVAWFAVCRPYSIPMGGMEPSLYRGDKVLVVKRWCDRALHRGDMVVYSVPQDVQDGSAGAFAGQCVARIVGMPGDTIVLDSASRPVEIGGRPSAYARELYRYDNSYDSRVAELLRKYDFGMSELLGYSGDDFVRALTVDECEFLQRANPDGLALRPLAPGGGEGATALVIPKKGRRVDVTPGNMALLCQALRRYEGCDADTVGGKLVVGGQAVAALVFGRDYYWLQSENVADLNDSRRCGIMPRSAFDGRLVMTLFSWSPSVGVRWNRLFRHVQ